MKIYRQKTFWLCKYSGVTKIKNISANNEAMLLKLGKDVAPYEIYQKVYILTLLWQHARFQSPASSKLSITASCNSTRQNTWSYLRRMPVPLSLGRLFNAKVKQQNRGPGFWKFNNSLLRDEAYVNELRKNVKLYTAKYESIDDKGLKWDLIKMEIRGFTVKYTKVKAKRRKNDELILQNKINELQLKLESNPNNSQYLNDLYAAKLSLQKIVHFKTKGAILRSKVRWYDEGERNTRYFFNLENRCQSKKNIDKLKIDDNTFIYDQFAILDKQKQFYESIYQSRENDNNNSQESVFFKAENITPLSLDDQLLCDGPITDAECINAINGFTKDKTPGTDGFSAEFYKFFWPELRAEMLSSFHFAFQTDHSRSVNAEELFLSFPKKTRTNHY